jgi:hypothetical protein
MAVYDRFSVITREALADFLDRCATSQTEVAEWGHFVVRHYSDLFLEEIRCTQARKRVLSKRKRSSRGMGERKRSVVECGVPEKRPN